jgi:hypothetical protein
MKVLVSDTIIKIQKEDNEKFYSESAFLYALKKNLIDMGYDVIKKRMWKDGHLVDDTQQYIRTRDSSWCCYNSHYAVYGLHEELERYGNVVLEKVEL